MPKIELASYVNFLEKYMEGVQNFVATDFSRLEYLKFLPIKCMFNVYPGPGVDPRSLTHCRCLGFSLLGYQSLAFLLENL